MFLKMYTGIEVRVRALLDPAVRDRGEGPIPHVVLIGVMAAIAIALGTMLLAVGRGWVNRLPTTFTP